MTHRNACVSRLQHAKVLQVQFKPTSQQDLNHNLEGKPCDELRTYILAIRTEKQVQQCRVIIQTGDYFVTLLRCGRFMS